MSQQSETIFKINVLRDLREITPNIWILKTQERSRRGVPDLVICLEGFFVAIELKIDGEKPDALQRITLDRIQTAEGVSFWTCPASWSKDLGILCQLVEKRKRLWQQGT
jgi:hypothetical protein